MNTPPLPAPRPRAVIAEDEPLLLEGLRAALARAWPELEVVAEAVDGVQALEALQTHRPDAVFLDIEMPGASGLEVARAASGRCHVVFITAFDQYAVDAFEHGAVDYLLKPLAPARLALALERLRERIHHTPPSLQRLLEQLDRPSAPARRPLRWLTVAVGRTLQLITCDEVCYFQADNKYTLVVTPTGQPLIHKTIRELAVELDPEVFLQVHRGTIVNLNAIAAIERDLRGSLKLRLKQRSERLPVSASFEHLFRHM